MKQVEDKLAELEIERQAGPIEQASFALSQGAAGRAIALLADAERNNVSPAVVKPRLIDLYCNTGQPDKALELLSVGAIDDPNLGTEPGSAALRQGRVYFLLGNYLSAATLWRDRAIPRVRFDRSSRAHRRGHAPSCAAKPSRRPTRSWRSPATLTQQASWEYDLAMCDLEAGSARRARPCISPRHSPWPPIWPSGRSRLTISRKWAKPVPCCQERQPAPRPPLRSVDKPGAKPSRSPLQARGAIVCPLAPRDCQAAARLNRVPSTETGKDQSPQKPAKGARPQGKITSRYKELSAPAPARRTETTLSI